MAISEAASPAEAPMTTDALISKAIDLLAAAVGSMRGEGPRNHGQPVAVRAPATALLRLATGRDQVDPAELGVPVARSRLILVSTASERVADALRRHVALPKRVVHATTATADWMLLVPGLPQSPCDDVATRDVNHVVAALRRIRVDGWHAGVSAPVEDAPQLPEALRDARDLAALAAQERRDVLSVDEAWARLAVARLRTSAWSALPTTSPLDVLQRYDRDNDSTLCETLATWLNAACDTQTTARALCIHVNTLRYRLGRAANIAGLDLHDPHQRVVLQLTQSAKNC